MLLILTHRVPLLVSRLVTQSVVHPSEDKQHKSKDVDANQHAVAAVVERFVVLAIDVSCDHTAHLHHHVVAGGGDGACAHTARVTGGETDEDGVAVRVAEQDCQKRKCSPGIDRSAGPGAKCDDTRQDPALMSVVGLSESVRWL